MNSQGTWFAYQVKHCGEWLTYCGILGASSLAEAAGIASAWSIPAGPRKYTDHRATDLRTGEAMALGTGQ